MVNYEEYVFPPCLSESIVNTAITFFKTRNLIDLPLKTQFEGVGVYAIYYFGENALYRRLGEKNRASKLENLTPIYAGKAVPQGWRAARNYDANINALYRRINEHSANISNADNLCLTDFKCRFIILKGYEQDLIAPIEATLIRLWSPLWNSHIDGFGNHDPGSGRYDQSPSEWDTIHPGRPWVERLRGIKPDQDWIRNKIENYLVML